MNMRDPVLYRIRYAPHHRTGNAWCIYPMYDYAHPLSDAIEEITHSICTLEFESHRPLYDWCIRETEVFPSRQIEFARLNLTYTVMSKRKLRGAGAEEGRVGLGRSAHADAGGAAAPRLHARGDPRLLRADRRRQDRQHHRRRAARARAARRSEPALAARDGGAAAAEAGDRQLPRGRGARAGGAAAPRGSGAGDAQGAVLARRLRRSRRLPRGPAEGLVPAGAGARGAPALRLPGRAARAWSRTRTARSPSCTRPGIRRRGAAARPTGARCAARCTGCRRRTRCPPRCGSTIACSPSRTPAPTRRRASSTRSTPIRSSGSRAPSTEPYLATAAKPGTRVQFERVGYFCLDPDSKPGKPIWNRTVGAQGQLGEDRERRAARQGEAPSPQARPARGSRRRRRREPRRRRRPEIAIDDLGKVDLRVGLVQVGGARRRAPTSCSS